MGTQRSGWWRDALLATALVTLFTLAWTLKDWANLSKLRLPDTDDVVRLQQIRDWLGGQAFADLTQYRLGPDGVPMHWSRLADLAPGGLNAVLTPLAGRHLAELAAVIVWPGILFAAALTLIGQIARAQQAPAPTAILVAALAFPATAMFRPGRIDHHGLQLALLLAMIVALLHRRGVASGAGVALAAVASLVVGMETAPFLALAAGIVVLGWAAERPGSGRHLAALGGALLAGLLVARPSFASDAWQYRGCDGFTGQVWAAGLIGGGALLTLAAAGQIVAGTGPRRLLALGVGGLAALAARGVAPECASPYGGVDPAVAARWLAHVGEAQSLFAAPLATAIGQCGLMVAGILAGLWVLNRTRDPGWAILLLFQGLALAISLFQLRGANVGALLAAPALGVAIAAARARGPLALAGAWAASAGILYPLAAEAMAPPRPAAAADSGACATPAALAALDRLPPGRVAGPVDLGAWGLAATRHSFLAAPYHRNNRGNRAAFGIADGPSDAARRLAQAWRVDYLATCGGAPPWIAREHPGWLHRILGSGDLTVYRIDRLPPGPAAP